MVRLEAIEEGRVYSADAVEAEVVSIVRIMYGGRDISKQLEENE